MKKLMKKFKHTLCPAVLILACKVGLATLLSSCGGDDSDSSNDNPDVGFGWVKISLHHPHNSSNSGGPYAHLEGTAFVSKGYTRHRCAGLCCFICRYDNSYPGVDVSWTNNATYSSASADSKYGNMTHWDHTWSAEIPLTLGKNDIDIRAFDPAGNLGNASVVVEYLPPAPWQLLIDSADNQITIDWENVWGADSYNIYWSTDPGVTKHNGIMLTYVDNPFIHSDIINGVSYYYVLTSNYADHESADSTEVSAIPGAPLLPTEVAANASDIGIIISWDDVPLATSYNLYWSNEPEVTTSGAPIEGVSSPYTHTDLIGLSYYYVVTAVNSFGESKKSPEVTAFPNLPPFTPTGMTIKNRNQRIEVSWNQVDGANLYRLYRCDANVTSSSSPQAGACRTDYWSAAYWRNIYSGGSVSYSDWRISPKQAYRYRVLAENDFGRSEYSEEKGVVSR